MLRLLARAIFGSTPSRDDPWAPIIEAATEKAVDATDPRLRAVRGYAERLREPVTRAAHFAHDLGERLAPPVEMARESFLADPRPRTFFSSVERMQEVFSTSLEVQEFLRDPGHRMLDRVYAALGMDLSEREVVAPTLRGDRVQHDVKRTLVSFDGHRVVLPAQDEARVRRLFKERAFTSLVECALARMAERRDQKEALQRRRGLLRAKLRALRSGRCGLDALARADGPGADTAAIERALEDAERELREAVADGDVLERNLEDLRDTLSHPEAFIEVSAATRRLTRMGYLAREDGDDEEAVDEVEFTQIRVTGRPPASGVLVSFPKTLLKPLDSYRDDMRRALGAAPGGRPH